MELAAQIAQLPPRRRRRLERLARLAIPVTALMTVLSLALAVATIEMVWAHSPGLVALSAGLGLLALGLSGVALRNARRTLRACRTIEATSAVNKIVDATPAWSP